MVGIEDADDLWANLEGCVAKTGIQNIIHIHALLITIIGFNLEAQFISL